MPKPAAIPPQLRLLPFRGTTAIAAGLLTRWQLESAAWRRLFPDVYIAADVELNHRLWCDAAIIYANARDHSAPIVVSGLSAAYLMGVDLLPLAGATVELTSPDDIRIRSSGLIVVRSRLTALDVAPIGRLPMTCPERTVFDIARRLDRVSAVAAVDALLHRGVTTIDRARAYLLGAPHFRGRGHAADIFGLSDGRSESPMESVLRVTLVDTGLPRPESQVEIFDSGGRFVARVDLAYRRQRVGIEYEGDHHRGRQMFRRDVARGNAIQAAGWTIIRTTAADIRNPDNLVQQIRLQLTRADVWRSSECCPADHGRSGGA